jgi:exodeoxyribonuclease VII small subunit
MAMRMSQEIATSPDASGLSFEDALRALEDVVRLLESGEVPLDESITLYERGESLRKACQARLDPHRPGSSVLSPGPMARRSACARWMNNKGEAKRWLL